MENPAKAPVQLSFGKPLCPWQAGKLGPALSLNQQYAPEFCF